MHVGHVGVYAPSGSGICDAYAAFANGERKQENGAERKGGREGERERDLPLSSFLFIAVQT